MNKKISKTALIIYIISGILIASFTLSIYNVTVYLQSLIQAGQLSLAENWLQIISYYMNNTSIYLALAALLFGVGYIVNYLKVLEREDAELEIIEETEENNEDVQDIVEGI